MNNVELKDLIARHQRGYPELNKNEKNALRDRRRHALLQWFRFLTGDGAIFHAQLRYGMMSAEARGEYATPLGAERQTAKKVREAKECTQDRA